MSFFTQAIWICPLSFSAAGFQIMKSHHQHTDLTRFPCFCERDISEEANVNIEIYATPFLAHAKRAWEDVLGRNLFSLGTFKTANQGPTEDITVITPVRGTLNGDVYYGFSTDTAKTVASLMMLRSFDELDEEAFTALGKLASVISGNAVAMLSRSGYECRVETPQIVQFDDDDDVSRPATQLHAAFNSGIGPMHMKFSLVEALDGMPELAELQRTHRR